MGQTAWDGTDSMAWDAQHGMWHPAQDGMPSLGWDRLWAHSKELSAFWRGYVRTGVVPVVLSAAFHLAQAAVHAQAQSWLQPSVWGATAPYQTGLQQASPQVKVNTNNCWTPLKICTQRKNEELCRKHPAANNINSVMGQSSANQGLIVDQKILLEMCCLAQHA